MRLHLDIRPRADRDVAETAEHIAEDNTDAAIKFLDATRRTLEFLTTSPGAGAEYEVAGGRRLKGLRERKRLS